MTEVLSGCAVRAAEQLEHADRMRADRKALFMCAAHCQGGHSDAGKAAAACLGIPFPVRMIPLVLKAREEGFDPDELWPWLRGMNPSLVANG